VQFNFEEDKMDSYLDAKKLSKYLHISYSKAIDLTNDPSFPGGIFDESFFSKAQVIIWIEQHINVLQTKPDNATVNATRVIIGNKA